MKRLHAAVAVIAAAGFTAVESAHAVIIEFAPAATSVAVGEAFAVDVVVSGLGDYPNGGEIISAFDLDVTYDAAVIAATDFRFSDVLGAVASDAFTSRSLMPGRIDFASVSLLDTASLFGMQSVDRLILGSLLFNAIGVGESWLSFDAFAAPGVLLVGSDPFESLPLTHAGAGAVLVGAPTSVPEPGTLGLVLTGLGYMAWSRRWRRRRST